ncbi:redoxin domain-containing protein [Fulvivirgaceae bacterium BMA10]|uniref:Redoxin domain-containing protein n=1 Tax=Splendidivirga corallicola TaxID=3051826 RepID=A0ABT8KWC3_9BACT|nr:redoxin domain-containing protein [Fulvivirgaceae bacterium BMA10]
MALKIGDKAPSFKLVNTEKKEISLEDFKNKDLVILFFPMAFTGTCTTELCTIRDDIGNYSNINADVVAISVDSPFSLGKFKEEQNLNFDLLSDFNKETSSAYGAIYEEFVLGLKGVSKRSAFVVDGEGTIKYAEVLETPTDLPNFDAIKAALA